MKWKFAEDRGNLDKVGFKDNDIEKFGQDPAKSIVREAIQNSCDALDIDKGTTKVEVVIRKGKIAKSEFPGFQSIENHIKACIQSDNDEAENVEVRKELRGKVSLKELNDILADIMEQAEGQYIDWSA